MNDAGALAAQADAIAAFSARLAAGAFPPDAEIAISILPWGNSGAGAGAAVIEVPFDGLRLGADGAGFIEAALDRLQIDLMNRARKAAAEEGQTP